MTKSTMTVVKLLNNLVEISVSAEKAATLLNVIMNDYFEKDGEVLKSDKDLAFMFTISYPQIQSLLSILTDYVCSVNNAVFDIASIEPEQIIL